MRVALLVLGTACTGCNVVFPLELGDRPPGCSPMSLLTDDFADGDTLPWWRTGGNGQATEVGGELLISAAFQQIPHAIAPVFLDLQETAFSIDVRIDAGGLTPADTSATILELISTIEPGGGKAPDRLRMYVQAGNLIADRFAGGDVLLVGQRPYVPEEHTSWKLAQTRNLTTWETAGADGVFTVLERFEDLPIRYVAPQLVVSCQIVGGCQTGFDNANGGGAPVGETCPARFERDDFAGPSLDFNRWHPVAGDCTWAQAGGQITATFGTPDLTDSCYVETATMFDLTDDAFAIELAGPPTTGGRAFLVATSLRDAQVVFEVTGGMLIAHDGAGTPFASKPFDPAANRWWRMRGKVEGGEESVVLEVSGNGRDYTFLAETTTLGSLSTIRFRFGIDGAGSGTVSFDNVNTD